MPESHHQLIPLEWIFRSGDESSQSGAGQDAKKIGRDGGGVPRETHH